MSRRPEVVFVDTGAWIALAVVRDALHQRARLAWEALSQRRTRLVTSVPVVIETFTYLDRKGSRELALAWRESIAAVKHLEVVGCTATDLSEALPWLVRRNLYRLSLVDATSFVLMAKHKVRTVLGFDTRFAAAGFRLVG
jgi:predicted nucleic acid-binding protein